MDRHEHFLGHVLDVRRGHAQASQETQHVRGIRLKHFMKVGRTGPCRRPRDGLLELGRGSVPAGWRRRSGHDLQPMSRAGGRGLSVARSLKLQFQAQLRARGDLRHAKERRLRAGERLERVAALHERELERERSVQVQDPG